MASVRSNPKTTPALDQASTLLSELEEKVRPLLSQTQQTQLQKGKSLDFKPKFEYKGEDDLRRDATAYSEMAVTWIYSLIIFIQKKKSTLIEADFSSLIVFAVKHPVISNNLLKLGVDKKSFDHASALLPHAVTKETDTLCEILIDFITQLEKQTSLMDIFSESIGESQTCTLFGIQKELLKARRKQYNTQKQKEADIQKFGVDSIESLFSESKKLAADYIKKSDVLYSFIFDLQHSRSVDIALAKRQLKEAKQFSLADTNQELTEQRYREYQHEPYKINLGNLRLWRNTFNGHISTLSTLLDSLPPEPKPQEPKEDLDRDEVVDDITYTDIPEPEVYSDITEEEPIDADKLAFPEAPAVTQTVDLSFSPASTPIDPPPPPAPVTIDPAPPSTSPVLIVDAPAPKVDDPSSAIDHLQAELIDPNQPAAEAKHQEPIPIVNAPAPPPNQPESEQPPESPSIILEVDIATPAPLPPPSRSSNWQWWLVGTLAVIGIGLMLTGIFAPAGGFLLGMDALFLTGAVSLTLSSLFLLFAEKLKQCFGRKKLSQPSSSAESEQEPVSPSSRSTTADLASRSIASLTPSSSPSATNTSRDTTPSVEEHSQVFSRSERASIESNSVSLPSTQP